MLAKQHIPGWAFDPRGRQPEIHFTTLEELQKAEWVKHWSEKPEFVRFSRSQLHTQRVHQSDNPVGNRYFCNLIAEMPESKEVKHWVVANIYGTMEEIVSLGLSEWVSPPQAENLTTPSAVLDTPPPTVDTLIAGGVLEFVTREPLQMKPAKKPTQDFPLAGDTWQDGKGNDILTVFLVKEPEWIEITDTLGADGKLDVGHRQRLSFQEFQDLKAAKGLGIPHYATNEYIKGSNS